ncbi:MAG: hypothetical protein AUJ12_02745 [Alphaproteobacteria bacterium CG1_02_46_17]|nr:MAG: hypothetical protein AUJ12_02745 [Alphaproteobacteria bacterium CG1_02_46_17]
MSSNAPFLPPLQAAQSAKAAIQAVAVRLINTPQPLQNNQVPVRLSGEVKGQTANGTTLVETKQGLVEIALKDKGSLPSGSRIEIDIPAGRNPQQAHIRPAPDTQTQQPVAPPPAPTLSEEVALTTRATTLERQQNLDNRTFDAVLQTKQTISAESQISNLIQVAKGDLLAGQYVRLIPIPPASAAALAQDIIAPLSTEAVLQNLLTTIQSLGADDAALKSNILNILARTVLPVTLQNSPNPTHINLIQNVQTLLQQSGVPSSFPFGLQNSASSTGNAASMPLQSFNPTTPIDAQILGFQSPAPPAAAGSAGGNISGGIAVANALPNAPSSVATGISTNVTPTPAGTPPSQPPPQTGQMITQQSPLSASGGNPTTLNGLVFISSQSVRGENKSIFSVNIGQVIGQTTQNLPIISIPVPGAGFNQSYVMQFEAQNLRLTGMETGATFGQMTNPVTNPAATSTNPTLPSPIFLSLQPDVAGQNAQMVKNPTWQSLQDLMLFLTQMQTGQNLQAANNSVSNLAAMIPSPAHPANLGALSMFFLSIFRSGDTENWMPTDTLAALRQSSKGRSILGNLTTDLARMTRADNAPVMHDWRGTFIPFLWEQQIYKVPLYYKEMPNEAQQENERKKRRLRFLFDLSLSRMGDVQIDGFLDTARLDLIMRTKTPLSPPMQTRMKRLYTGAVEKSNMTGELSFQFKPETWVDFSKPLEGIGVEA